MSQNHLNINISTESRRILFEKSNHTCPVSYIFQDIRSRIVHNIDRTLEWSKVKCKYENRMSIYDFLYDGNTNNCQICQSLQDIRSRDIDNINLVFDR